MTIDEANTLLNILYERLENGALDYMEDGTLDALDMAREALEQPQPDPDTGLVPCGCGGKPTFLYSYVARDDECCIECPRCEAKSALRLGGERARDSWNTAMGLKGAGNETN